MIHVYTSYCQRSVLVLLAAVKRTEISRKVKRHTLEQRQTTTRAEIRRPNFRSFSAIEKVGRHEQFESDFGHDGKLGNLGRAITIALLVREVLAHFHQHVRPAEGMRFLMELLKPGSRHQGRGGGSCPKGNPLFTVILNV